VSVVNISLYDLKAVGTVSFNLKSILKLGPLKGVEVSVGSNSPKS